MMRSMASVCLKLSNLTSLPCLRTFFQLHHNQSASLHHISFFSKMCVLLFLSFLSKKCVLFMSFFVNEAIYNHHVMTDGEILYIGQASQFS